MLALIVQNVSTVHIYTLLTLFDVLNCIIMYVKHYINVNRNKNKSFLFIELLGLIKEKVKILVQIEEGGCPVITDRGKMKVAFYKLLLV